MSGRQNRIGVEQKQPFRTVLEIPDIRAKLGVLEETCRRALVAAKRFSVPLRPARDVQVLPLRELPQKMGLSTALGQARLLHDLANIELQAMEMGVRTLLEYPDAPAAFRQRLAEVTLEEGVHLQLCLDGIQDLGGQWGDWPVHLGLWESLSPQDSLLDRILIVHRYLEGSGLDAGETICRRLKGVSAKITAPITERIAKDEVVHVQFGSEWYREICRREGLNPAEDFPVRLERLSGCLPRRREPLAFDLRRQAGFDEGELLALEEFRRLVAQQTSASP